MKTYSFSRQNLIGKLGEEMLDKWLRGKYSLTDVSDAPYFKERCIDRILEAPGISTLFIEYKFDKAAKRTGNIFFETTSVDTKSVPGWGWRTQADYLMILIPSQEIIVLKPEALRALMWKERYSVQEKYVPNVGYKTIGFPISLIKVREYSFYWKEFDDNLDFLQPPLFC